MKTGKTRTVVTDLMKQELEGVKRKKKLKNLELRHLYVLRFAEPKEQKTSRPTLIPCVWWTSGPEYWGGIGQLRFPLERQRPLVERFPPMPI